jgi:16S rRNA (guanine527-N7)-methyltransferase
MQLTQKLLVDKLPNETLEALKIFSEDIHNYNQHTNITGLKTAEDIWSKHIIDSFYVNKFTKNKNHIIDIGTGAGLPGLVLSLLNPEQKITLIESTGKKIKFLEQCIEKYKLKNTTTFYGRAEEYPLKSGISADLAIVRSVASIDVLAEYASPLLELNGELICMKDKEIEQELSVSEKKLKLFGFKLKTSDHYSLNNHHRSLLIYEKTKPTPPGYPRQPGLAKKESKLNKK